MLLGKFAWLLMAKYFCHLVPLLNVNFFKYWQKRSTWFLTLGRRREEEMGEDVIFSFGKWSSILSQSLSYSSLWSSSSEVRFSRDHCCMHRRQLLSTPPVVSCCFLGTNLENPDFILNWQNTKFRAVAKCFFAKYFDDPKSSSDKVKQFILCYETKIN